MNKIRISIAFAALLIYLAIPTKNYYWDGISFAQAIESAPNWTLLFHPNHLIYNFIGSAAYQIFGGGVRALYLLQALNSIFAAATIYVLSGIIAAITESAQATLLLSLAFAFSGTYWRFATDADAYILSVLLLTICASLLLLSRRPRPLAVAAIHMLAMLIHQLAFLFFPAALFVIWSKRSRDAKGRLWPLSLYLCSAGTATISAYFEAFHLQTGKASLRDFMAWTTSHATDVDFSFQLLKNFLISVRSWLQLIFAGRPSIVKYSDPMTMILLITLVAALVFVAGAMKRRHAENASVGSGTFDRSTAFRFALIWLGSYVVFLLFWLPNNTFYKLFGLPAIAIAIASRWRLGARLNPRSPVTAGVAALALFNLTFAIIPYSKQTANPAIDFAFQLRQPLGKGATVYFHDFNTDDWFARYFTPSAEWKHIDTSQPIDADLRRGKAVWLDTTAIDLFSATNSAWFNPLVAHAEWHQLVNAKHHIRFVRISPP